MLRRKRRLGYQGEFKLFKHFRSRLAMKTIQFYYKTTLSKNLIVLGQAYINTMVMGGGRGGGDGHWRKMKKGEIA